MANPFRILTGMALLVLSFGAFAQFIVTGNRFWWIQLVGGKSAKMLHSTSSTGKPVTLVLHAHLLKRSAYRTEYINGCPRTNHVWK